MVQDFLHTDQIAYSSEGELPGGLIMPAGQICYEKETLCNAYKMGAFCYIYDSAILCSLFRRRNASTFPIILRNAIQPSESKCPR